MDDSSTVVRYRIMAVAARHFAERKYTDVNISDIIRDLMIDRSVVKHHFATKEDLLAALIDSFLQNIEDILIMFVKGVLLPAIESGKLEIKDDRLHFENAQCAAIFNNQVINHLEAVFDYLLVHSHEYILLLQESLIPGEHSDCIERLLCLFLPIATNPLLVSNKAIPEIGLTPEAQADFIQASVLPILGYILVKENLNRISQHCVETHKKQILNDIRDKHARHTIGSDIFFNIKQ